MAEPLPHWLQWTMILVMTALLLSLLVVAQVVTMYSAAYLEAPRDVSMFVDAVDFSITENEGYDRDLSKVQRLEDKLRLSRLLRQIQKRGDNLREQLNGLLIAEDSTTLKISARLLWASRRKELEDSLRRLDLLRMRFLVLYLGILTSTAENQPPTPPALTNLELTNLDRSPVSLSPSTPAFHKSLNESIAKRPPLRRLTTQAIGCHEKASTPHRKGWAGVVEELQTSPRMHRRHASTEQSMTRAST